MPTDSRAMSRSPTDRHGFSCAAFSGSLLILSRNAWAFANSAVFTSAGSPRSFFRIASHSFFLLTRNLTTPQAPLGVSLQYFVQNSYLRRGFLSTTSPRPQEQPESSRTESGGWSNRLKPVTSRLRRYRRS